MLRETIAIGDTIEIAFKNACNELNVDTSKAEMEVIEQPVKKTFGLFGGSPAKVRAFINITPQDKALEYLNKVFEKMGITDLNIEVIQEEDGILINLEATDISFIIGHRGDTLDSLQYLTSLVANQGEEKYLRISIDVGTFRSKRKETLENLGKKVASKALKYGRNQILEPMNPYERRIIHFAVSSVEGVKSWSEGEDLNRHVVIGPIDSERRFNKPRYNNDRKPSSTRPYNKPRYNNNDNKGERPNNRRTRPENNENREFREKVQKAVIYENVSQEYVSAPIDNVNERKKEADAPLYGRIK